MRVNIMTSPLKVKVAEDLLVELDHENSQERES